MYIGGVVASSVLMATMVVVTIFVYSYATYVTNRLFTKTKLSIVILVIVGLIIAGLLFVGIYLATRVNKEPLKAKQYAVLATLMLVDTFLMLANYLAYIFVTVFSNNNKIDYKSIPTINWTQKIEEMKAKVDVEALKAAASTSKKKYHLDMLNAYVAILTKAKDPTVTDADKMADIVVFNENFTHKWSTKNNNLQLLLTYEFCKIFNK